MNRRGEYKCTILGTYHCAKDFIEWSKSYGFGKEQLDLLVDEYFNLYDIFILCALRDDFINQDDYDELLATVDTILDYLKECCE